jgi:hypothetical protein
MANLWRKQPSETLIGDNLIKKRSGQVSQTLVVNEFFGVQGGTTPLKDFLSNSLFQSGSALGITNSEYSVGGTPLKNVNSNTLV